VNLKSIFDIKDIVLDILSKHRVCTARELSDRAYNEHNINYGWLKKATNKLLSEKRVDIIKTPSPYSKPCHFYFNVGLERSEVNQVISWKIGLIQEYKELLDKGVSRFGESLIGKVATNFGYEDVEIRKKSENTVGIGRRDIDVWGIHPNHKNIHQGIEVKNRKDYVRGKDIRHFQKTMKIAYKKWKIPFMPGFVCRCIDRPAYHYAKSLGIPVAATEKVYVSKQYESFYNQYKEALGAYYIEVADLDNPPKDLIELFRKYILHGS
jgi:hypothetical protein